MIKIELLNNGLYDSTFIFENNQLITEDAPIGSRGDKTKIYYIKKYANNKGFKKSFIFLPKLPFIFFKNL